MRKYSVYQVVIWLRVAGLLAGSFFPVEDDFNHMDMEENVDIAESMGEMFGDS